LILQAIFKKSKYFFDLRGKSKKAEAGSQKPEVRSQAVRGRKK
jgi:hypothetical protein